MRCEGRLVNSDLNLDARRPFILPRRHHLTKLIIRENHEGVYHSGVRATLAQLRSKYWVPKGRQEVKRVLSECVTCRKLKGKSYSSPPTAALPEFRVREAPPFSRVGVDFAGPLYVKSKTGGMEKVYIALFSCCVTRAIHLELVEDLSAAAFRHCLRRFAARYGTPALIVSDNAKPFKRSTEKALNELFNHPAAEVGDVVLVLEEEKKRGEWRVGVVENLVRGSDNVVRGAKVRAVTKRKPTHLSRPVQKLYPLEIKSQGEGDARRSARGAVENSKRAVPRRNAALDSRWKSRLMLDS